MPSSPSIGAKDLNGFPRPVAKVIIEAVNQHGVVYRKLDGTHIRLYCGDRNIVPLKIAGVRPAEHTLRYLLPWLEENIPTWSTRDVTADSIKDLAAVVNTSPEVDSSPAADTGGDSQAAEEEQDTSTQWVDHKYGFETDGTNYRCKTCGWTREDARGLHLHADKHENPEAIQKRAEAGNAAKNLHHSQRAVMRKEAVRVLAQQNGLVVFDKEDAPSAKEFARLNAEIERLTAEAEKWKNKAGELQARMDLLKEAMRA